MEEVDRSGVTRGEERRKENVKGVIGGRGVRKIWGDRMG